MVPVICINDKHRPFQISEGEWIKKDEQYHITEIAGCSMNGITGVSLYEKPLDHDKHFPYIYFALRRFAIRQDDSEALIQLAKDCSELSDLDVNKMVKKIVEEHQLEVVE